jgi:hypothetical protein
VKRALPMEPARKVFCWHSAGGAESLQPGGKRRREKLSTSNCTRARRRSLSGRSKRPP